MRLVRLRPVKKAWRLGILVALLSAGGALAFAGAAPEGYLGVSQVLDGAYDGREIEVKASVLEGSLVRNGTPVTFALVEDARTLEVRWDPASPLPDAEVGGTIEGKNVVVRGTLARGDDGAPYLAAREMIVGCASKYQPDEG